MNIRSIYKFQLVLVLSLLLACSDDDDKKSSYSFKDQVLSGEIGGDAWTFGDGFVEESEFDDEEILDFRLFLAHDGSVCSVPDGDNVIFFVPRAVGLYKLSLNSSFEGQVVNMVEDDDIPINNIATEGAIEILTISETEVTGRIDARMDSDNHINGNFTVSFCAGT